MLYINGHRAHPVAMINDRRVRPYGMQPGEGGFYSCEGSGQILYHRVRGDSADGFYMVTCDDQGGGQRADGSSQQQQTRHISIRHANKQKQPRKKQQQQGGGQLAADGGGGGQQSGMGGKQYKHEGDSINTEQTFTKGEIRWNDSGGTKGRLAVGGDWLYHDGSGAPNSIRADTKHSHIRNGGADVWVQGVPYKSMPFVVKPDPCSGK